MPPPVGGTSVAFSHLIAGLRTRNDVECRLIDTGGIRLHGWRGIWRYLKLIRNLYRLSRDVDVITVHVSLDALIALGSLVALVARRWRRPFLFRSFGGKFIGDRRWPFGWLSVAIVRPADKYLVETEECVRKARYVGLTNVQAFGNSRPLPAARKQLVSGRKCARFLFLGHVNEGKGIRDIVAAARRLTYARVDIFGPLASDITVEQLSGMPNLTWRGFVDPERVLEIMREYDALLMPTHYDSEGQPGVIIEAFAMGLPVIATRRGGIPEMIDETCGILITPRSVDGLCRAMTLLMNDDALFSKLQIGALKRSARYNQNYRLDEFVGICRALGSKNRMEGAAHRRVGE